LKTTSAQRKGETNMTFPSTILFGDDPGSGSGGRRKPAKKTAKKKPAAKK
jgi:hypothetical protein